MHGLRPVGEVPAGWSVDFVVMPVRGACRWSRRSILLDIRLSRAEERCTLTHELVHAERGPFPCWLTAREEAAVNAEAARRLIPLDALGGGSRVVAVSRGCRFGGSHGIRGPSRPGICDEPRLVKGFCWLIVGLRLYRPARPRKAGPWGTPCLQSRLFALVVVAGGLFSRSVSPLVSPGCVH